jgi:hypothetical protein
MSSQTSNSSNSEATSSSKAVTTKVKKAVAKKEKPPTVIVNMNTGGISLVPSRTRIPFIKSHNGDVLLFPDATVRWCDEYGCYLSK